MTLNEDQGSLNWYQIQNVELRMSITIQCYLSVLTQANIFFWGGGGGGEGERGRSVEGRGAVT